MDDIVLLFRRKDASRADAFIAGLRALYEMNDLGELQWFLGILILRNRATRKLWLCQDSYIEKIANTFSLTLPAGHRAPTTPLPLEPLVKYDGKASPESIHSFQRKVGHMQYAAVITRADIARAASKLAEFLTNPSPTHHAAADQGLQYLNSTKSYAIQVDGSSDGPEDLLVATDAAFGDAADRKSTQGFLVKLFGAPILWKSGKQATVTTSTTEAELLSLSAGASELYSLKRLFQGLDFDLGRPVTTILCDNQQTIRLVTAEIPQLTTRLKHVDIRQHWLRQEVQEGRLAIEYLPSSQMPADGLTKALSVQKFRIFVQQLGLMDIKDLLKDCE